MLCLTGQKLLFSFVFPTTTLSQNFCIASYRSMFTSFFLTKLSQNNLPCMLQAKGCFLFLLLTRKCLKILLCILQAKCYSSAPNCLKILPCILQAKAYFFISFFLKYCKSEVGWLLWAWRYIN